MLDGKDGYKLEPLKKESDRSIRHREHRVNPTHLHVSFSLSFLVLFLLGLCVRAPYPM